VEFDPEMPQIGMLELIATQFGPHIVGELIEYSLAVIGHLMKEFCLL
jgi:hypothetical protein